MHEVKLTDSHFEKLVEKFKGEYWDKLLTLGELIELAEAEGVSFGRLVAAEPSVKEALAADRLLGYRLPANKGDSCDERNKTGSLRF
jgi:hypothetical protein